jgi:hypothetical protein
MPPLPWTATPAADEVSEEVVVMAFLLQLDSVEANAGLPACGDGYPQAGPGRRRGARRRVEHCTAPADLLHALGLARSSTRWTPLSAASLT